MRRVNYFLILMIIAVIAFTCYVQDNSPTSACATIEKPDKIIIYKKGTEITVTEDNKLFDTIMEHISKRLEKVERLGFTRTGIEIKQINNIKKNEMAIEFIHNDLIKKSINSSGETIFFEYTSLFIPLTGDSSEEIFLNHNGLITPVGIFPAPDDLVGLLE